MTFQHTFFTFYIITSHNFLKLVNCCYLFTKAINIFCRKIPFPNPTIPNSPALAQFPNSKMWQIRSYESNARYCFSSITVSVHSPEDPWLMSTTKFGGIYSYENPSQFSWRSLVARLEFARSRATARARMISRFAEGSTADITIY